MRQNPVVDLNQFIRIKRPRWERLAYLLDRVEQRSLGALAPDELDELFRLYRLSASDLNWAQTQTGNPALIEYLESTVARAYSLLAPPARARPVRAWWRIMRHRFPAAVRAERRVFALSAAIFVLGGLFGALATIADPDLSMVFLPAEHLTETPSERVADLEEEERNGGRVDGGMFTIFSSFLFTHNIRVCVFAFGLGLTFGVGTAVVLLYNGAMLGCITWRYFDDGVGEFFVAWVGPHGSIELPCVVFAGAAGFILGRAQWRSARTPLWQRLAEQRPKLLALVVGTSTWLVVAGVIEGGFSQINEPTLPYPLKIAVAGLLFAMLMGYLFVLPVDEAAGRDAAGGGLEIDGGVTPVAAP